MSISKGYSLIEVSLCFIISSTLILIFMTFYKDYIVDAAIQSSAKQISNEIKTLKKYIMKNGDGELSYNKYCVAELDNKLIRKILDNAASTTLLNQHIDFFLKKENCHDEAQSRQAYHVLLPLSGGRDINLAEAGRIAAMIGNSGGVYSSENHSFQGWKNGWYVDIRKWGLGNDDYWVGAYDYFVKDISKASDKITLYNMVLLPLPNSMASTASPMPVQSSDDKVKITWRGSHLKYIGLTLTLIKNDSAVKTITVNMLSQNYGGEYFLIPYSFFSSLSNGKYSLQVKVMAYDTNDRVVSSLTENLNMDFNWQ